MFTSANEGQEAIVKIPDINFLTFVEHPLKEEIDRIRVRMHDLGKTCVKFIIYLTQFSVKQKHFAYCGLS